MLDMRRAGQVARVCATGVLTGALLFGCGDDKASPEAVDIEELKFASGLTITDLGNGTVQLSWLGTNNEDDFSGYNIYGAKTTTGSEIQAKEGQTIQLLNDTGDPIEAGRALLAQMSYNGTDWESVGTVESDDDDDKFKFFPYYVNKNEDDEPIVPSCTPSGENCAVSDADTDFDAVASVNGRQTLQLAGLVPGGLYCFTVLSTLDEGNNVAQTTSEVECVAPRHKIETTFVVDSNEIGGDTSTGRNMRIDLKAVREACAAGTCTFTGTEIASGNFCNGDNTTEALCIENVNGSPNFTAGLNAGVQDLGYYTSGHASSDLPTAPALQSINTLQNVDGYSLAFQSVFSVADHIYVVAEPVPDGTTSFYYHWFYISSIASEGTTKHTYTMDIRISTLADERRGNQ